MSDSNTPTSTSGGIGFTGLLTIVFVVAKITGYLNWSWWWVFSPLWISALIVLGILLVIMLVWGLAQIAVAILDR